MTTLISDRVIAHSHAWRHGIDISPARVIRFNGNDSAVQDRQKKRLP
jgi:hypothetical protein